MKLFYLLLIFCFSQSYGSEYTNQRYPDNFRFGVATSAYQIEGAWDRDGKGESVWDRYLHDNPEVVKDGVNADVATDSYHLFKRDVEMLRELGVDYYRFSMSWSRIMPDGLNSSLNEQGLAYYDKLLDELGTYKIEAMVTMYHNDLPQHLQDLGGWANPSMVQWFEDYAKALFDRYGMKVKYWITINEPSKCFDAYDGRNVAPALNSKGIDDFMCLKNMLIAHARVHRLYHTDYRNKRIVDGMVGFTANLNWIEPLHPKKTKHFALADLYRAFAFDLYLHPFWSKEGDWPKLVKDEVAKKSKKEGLDKSRLPELTNEEVKLLKKASDFIGMNHYTTYNVHPKEEKLSRSCMMPDLDACVTQGSEWLKSKAAWLKAAPYGLYKACIYLIQTYERPPMIITEHGWATGTGLMDRSRIEVIKEYMKALIFSLVDGGDIRGYTAWSLMDNIEWTAGTTERYGLYEVDFDSPEKTRTARASAHFYRHTIHTKTVDFKWKPSKNLTIQISDRRIQMKPYKPPKENILVGVQVSMVDTMSQEPVIEPVKEIRRSTEL